MENFIHRIKTELYFGKGAISNLGALLDRYGKRVLLTYGGGAIKRIGLYDEVLRILRDGGFSVTECDGIEPNPRLESVEKGVRLCRENQIDVILSVGGGSTLDCSKAIAVGTFYEGDLWEMVKTGVAGRKALPLVDIITVAATGSEFDGGGVITNTATNEKVFALYTYPAASICDPTYTFSVSPYQTAAGSIDIMSHAIEDYFSKTDDCDLSEGLAETILRSVIKNLPLALSAPDNYSARANLMYDATIACSTITGYGKRAGGWPCHAIEHIVSAFYDLTHGVGMAILLPRWMRFVLEKEPKTTERFAHFARQVFGLSGADLPALARDGIDALEAFFRSTGIPMTFTECGIDRTHFTEMAKQASANIPPETAYVPLTAADIVELLNQCL